MDRLNAMQLFARVVESGSFSKAARAEGVVQPTVSKQIAALEDHLGAQLLNRTSRGISLTAAGQDFYDSAVRLLDELDEAEARVGRGQIAPSGLVRVATSAAIGRMYLVPHLPDFFARYPDIRLDFDVSERHVSLIEDGVDVALRIGNLADSTPVYLDRFGEPKTPAELAGHACIGFIFQGAPQAWRFNGPVGPIVLEPHGAFRSNDAEHIRAAVLAGVGIGHNASWLYAPAIGAGMLKPLLGDYAPHPNPIHAVCPAGRRVPGRVRAFIDFLAEICAADPHLRIR
jgi:LysR family transcriptional regulator, regulator for bpeEF and oprC